MPLDWARCPRARMHGNRTDEHPVRAGLNTHKLCVFDQLSSNSSNAFNEAPALLCIVAVLNGLHTVIPVGFAIVFPAAQVWTMATANTLLWVSCKGLCFTGHIRKRRQRDSASRSTARITMHGQSRLPLQVDSVA